MEVLEWLVEAGADLKLRNSQGKTALDVARRYGNKECIKALGGNPSKLAAHLQMLGLE